MYYGNNRILFTSAVEHLRQFLLIKEKYYATCANEAEQTWCFCVFASDSNIPKTAVVTRPRHVFPALESNGFFCTVIGSFLAALIGRRGNER